MHESELIDGSLLIAFMTFAGLSAELVDFISPVWTHRKEFFGAVLAYFATHLLIRVIVVPTLIKRGTDLHKNFIVSRLRPRQ